MAYTFPGIIGFASIAFSTSSALSILLTTHARFAKIDDAARYRQSAFSVMGTHFGRVGAVVKDEKPYDKASVEADTTSSISSTTARESHNFSLTRREFSSSPA